MPMGNTLKLEDLLKPDCLPDESVGGENWRILHGDTLKLVKGFQPGIFDAVVTDPPYASGGTKQNERNRTTNQKYSSMKAENALPDFDGDNKDQRSWTHWMAEWLYDVRKACKRGAPICLFIDWRQYPSITDALQWAGWIWRGTAVWDKGNSRPQKAGFASRQNTSCGGSNGPDANQPPGVLSSGCVPLWESPEPHPCDRKAAPADEGCHPDLRAGRPDLRPVCRSWHDHPCGDRVGLSGSRHRSDGCIL